MAKHFFPNANKQYLQTNRTDVYPVGNLWSSFNLDLQTDVGAMLFTPRLRVTTSTTDDANFGLPVAARWYGNKVWAICGTRIFTNSGNAPSNNFTADATTGFQTDYEPDESDMEVFNGALVASTTDALYSTDGSSWTNRDTLNVGSPHMMTYFKKFDRLYYSDLGDLIRSIDTGWVTSDPGNPYAITLGSVTDAAFITCLQSSANFIWIGGMDRTTRARRGFVYSWDGISAAISVPYYLQNAGTCMALTLDPQRDIPYAMDSNGILSGWNGSGFEEVGRLPFGISTRMGFGTSDPDNGDRFIHPNGMYFTKNGTVLANINNRQNVSTFQPMENLPSGIWEWSKATGFVHRESFTYNYNFSSTITDYGQNQISKVGCLVAMEIPNTTSNSQGTLLAGATIYSDATSTYSVLEFDGTLDDIQKKGYFVTTWYESDEIADKWDRWWMSFRKFLDANDSVVAKYRTSKATPASGTITWVDTTHFTVANSSVDVSQYWTSGTGGEVEIVRGTGGGSCVHITNAVLAGGTWTVTVDDAVTGVTTGTAIARFQNWIKLEPEDTTDGLINAFTSMAIGTDSTPRIQMKVCFTLTGQGEFYKGAFFSTEDIKITQ